MLMIGSPGTGKTMLARRLPTILPPLAPAESLETTRIYTALGRLPSGEPLMTTRPFRSPHHTISDAGMVGGGSVPAPGEISLAHHGVLFLDELPEFNRRSLEVLRQPLEEGRVTISRALNSSVFILLLRTNQQSGRRVDRLSSANTPLARCPAGGWQCGGGSWPRGGGAVLERPHRSSPHLVCGLTNSEDLGKSI
jgi:hypothetical protein